MTEKTKIVIYSEHLSVNIKNQKPHRFKHYSIYLFYINKFNIRFICTPEYFNINDKYVADKAARNV